MESLCVLGLPISEHFENVLQCCVVVMLCSGPRLDKAVLVIPSPWQIAEDRERPDGTVCEEASQ